MQPLRKATCMRKVPGRLENSIHSPKSWASGQALLCLYGQGREGAIFGSHAPGDVKYRQDLMKSVIGDWTVEAGERDTKFRVFYSNSFYEPVGGQLFIEPSSLNWPQ